MQNHKEHLDFYPTLKITKFIQQILKLNPKEVHLRHRPRLMSVDMNKIKQFASSEQTPRNDKDQEMYIKKKQKINEVQEEQQEQPQDKLLPYLKYKRYESPQQQLRNMGYDPDVRIAAEVYSDKIEQRKIKYLNKMDSLKRQLENNSHIDRRQNRMEKSRIQVKILGEEIRRKRQRELLVQEQRRGQRLLNSLLNPINQVQAS